MRFIVKEQRYEKQIASGRFRYEREGQPTGAVEDWRLTRAMAGYEVLRVDLDARAAASGHSYLYHLVRQENGRPERLAYRFWGDGLQVEGTLLFDETSITGTRAVNGVTTEEDLDIAPGTGFWFPSAVGLGLAANLQGVSDITAVTLNNQIGGPDTLALQQVTMNVTMTITDTVEIEIAGQMVDAVPYKISWDGNVRFVTRDLNFWPLQIERPEEDGSILTAVETRNIWYGR